MTRNLTNQTLDNRYFFSELVGEGTFARVYRVHDTRRGVDLAAKVLREDIAHEPTFLARFRQEAAVLGKLGHPHIVRYYDTIETEQATFILLDFIDGHTLQTYFFKREKPLDTPEVLELLKPICAALHFAHGEGIIHRDIKPANILLGKNNQVYLTDFGIARLLNEASNLTLDSSIGTPLYMAPEQILGEKVSPQTDVYTLGILLYQMFTLERPFVGESADAEGTSRSDRVAFEHIKLEPPSPKTHNSSIADEVETIIMRCLQKTPSGRYHGALAVYDALAETIGAAPASLDPLVLEGTPSPPSGKLPEWSQVMKQVVAQSEPLPPTPLQTTPPAKVPAKANQADTLVAMPSVQHSTIPHPAIESANAVPVYDPPPTTNNSSIDGQWRQHLGIGLGIGAVGMGIILCLFGIVFTLLFVTNRDDENNGVEADKPIIESSESVATRSTNLFTSSTQAPPTTQSTQPIPQTIISPTPSDAPGYAFSMDDDDGTQIWVADSTDAQPRKITSGSDTKMGATWSPDGSQLAYYAYGRNNRADIYLINADGSNVRQITDTASANERVVTWSPNGQQIAYHSNADGDFDIYVYDLNAGLSRNLTANEGIDDLGAAWSPDGSQIAFHSDEINGFFEVFVIGTDGANRRQLSDGQWTASFPAWSPDGSRIAFHVILNNRYQLYTIDADGTNAQALFESPQNERHPDWSPDGNAIIYMRGDTNNPSIYQTDFVTGETTRIAANGAFPDWKP